LNDVVFRARGASSQSTSFERNHSLNTVKSLVHRMRRCYRALLRAGIEHTVAEPEEVDEEIRHLTRVLGS